MFCSRSYFHCLCIRNRQLFHSFFVTPRARRKLERFFGELSLVFSQIPVQARRQPCPYEQTFILIHRQITFNEQKKKKCVSPPLTLYITEHSTLQSKSRAHVLFAFLRTTDTFPFDSVIKK